MSGLDSSAIQKIVKLLMLSTSDNDHEALSSIRMAHRLLSGLDLSWEQLFKAKLRLDRPTPPRSYSFMEFESLNYSNIFDTLTALNLTPKEEEFIENVHSFYCKAQRLTDRQIEVLYDIYLKAWRRG